MEVPATETREAGIGTNSDGKKKYHFILGQKPIEAYRT